MPDIALNAPYSTQQAELDRRRKLVQILQQQSMEPLTQPSMAGVRVSPYEGLARILQGLGANYKNAKLDKEQRSLDTSKQDAIRREMAKVLGSTGGATPQTQTIGTPGLPTPGQSMDVSLSPDPGLTSGFGSQFPQVQQMAAALMGQRQDQAKAQQQQQFTGGQNDLTRGVQMRGQDATFAAASAKNDAALRQKGFKLDPTGKVVPIGADEMSDTEKAALDYKNAMTEYTKARSDAEAAKADPNSEAFKLAQARLKVSEQNAQTAIGRLGIQGQQFEMRAFGTNNGTPLPGVMLNADGTPIGTANALNVRPTSTERNKADMGNSAKEQLGDIKSIVTNRPDVFGPAAGRKTDFTVWLGSQDPDAQRFRAARTIAADHLASTFGGRSEAALAALDAAIGQFKDNPKAVIAGLDQLDKANDIFINAGTVRTAKGRPVADTQRTRIKF